MTTIELKEYIYKNKKIECVLESLNCHNIKYNDKHSYYSASFPDGDNLQGINIRNNEYLNYRSFSRNVSNEDGKDIIDLVEYIKGISFIEAIKYLHNILGLDYKYQRYHPKQKEKREEDDPLYIFTKYKCHKEMVNVNDIPTIDEDMLDTFIPLLHESWFDEGITERTRKKFGICYSYKKKRIIIPHRWWLTGELIGMNTRTTIENYEELGIPKYILTNGMNKSLNIYGYWENHEDINKLGYCTLFEGEKSALRRYSLNDHSGLSLSGKFISDEQIRIILSLNVKEIIVALDKDVDINEVRFICEKFWRFRQVSYIYDKWDLIGLKDSPADASNKIYNFLFKYRIKYDESEHKEYLKSLCKL